MERSPRREESEDERLDRNLNELLQELRVALPGVQVLFAFLLAVPFQARFGGITEFQKSVYFVTLICSALSAALLMVPTAYHRAMFRARQRPHLVKVANRATLAGMGFLVPAMTGAVILVTDFIFGTAATVITGVVVGGFFVALWWVLPFGRRWLLSRR